MNLVLSGLCLAAAVVASNSTSVASAPAKTNRVAKITAASTYYDSKEGVGYFAGGVFVDDQEYQLHSDTAYVFMDTAVSNTLKRIVAVGNVALTNGTHRAYGDKLSYYRESKMVVLYEAKSLGYCEVRDEKSVPPQSVKGKKIKFWIGADQVQVENANISAPVNGDTASGLKGVLGH